MGKRNGSTFIKILLFLAIGAIVIILAIKYAGKPVTQMAVGPAEQGKKDIERAQAAADAMNKAVKDSTKAAEEAGNR